jgi:hypothetical protein
MKSPVHFLRRIMVASLLAAGMMMPSSFAATSPAVSAPEATKSIFIMPANPKQGRDPFFPDSTRPYESAVVNSPSAALSALILKGFSGPPENRLVIINDHTFAVGDEEDITTAVGKIRVRCIAIKDNSAVIEAGGQREELTFQGSQ